MPRVKRQKDAAPAPTAQRLFKVTGPNGEAIHGGTLSWSLPNGTPGEWHEVTGAIACCENGLHLCRLPVNWWRTGARLFEAEYEGETDTDGDGDKIAVRRARLVRELSWDDHAVWTTGEHTVSSGRAVASGSATVLASGSATVEAFDSATVRAFDSATVEASDSATVRAFGSATVLASGSATVLASGSATVEAKNDTTVIRSKYHTNGKVTLADQVVSVDRRHETVYVETADGRRA